MALKEDLVTCRKLDSGLRSHIRGLSDETDEDQPLFSAILRASEQLSIPGLNANHVAGGIFTAHGLSLAMLKTLADHPDVYVVQGSSPLHPENRPQGPV